MTRFVAEPKFARSPSAPPKQLHWADFGPALLLIGDGIPLPGLGFPVSLVGVGLLLIVAFTRRPTMALGKSWWVPWLLVVLLVWVVFVSVLATPTEFASLWPRRAIRILGVLLLMMSLATGRLHLPSVIKAVAIALGVNAAAFYVGLTPDDYEGALTGWLGDKNKAGLFYSVAGILVLLTTESRAARIVLVSASGALLWLTGSRTSMSAYGFALLWLWLVSGRAAPVRWLAAGGTAALAVYLEQNFAQAGVFESRWGSDLLRDKIDAAALAKVAQTPIQGMGLGEAYVMLDGRPWYFHDAYATLLVEGGWIYLVGVVALTAWIGLRPFSPGEAPSSAGRVTQAATVALLICAWKLGEVFLTIPWALTVGAAFHHLLTQARAPGNMPRPGPRDG